MKTIQMGLFLLCISALSSGARGGSSAPQFEDWKSRSSEAQTLFDAGQWNSAEAAYLQALQLARSAPDNTNATVTSLNELSLFYMSTRRFDKAASRLSESLALQAKIVGGNDPALVTVINRLGISYRELGRYTEALAAHQRALTILENTIPERWSEIGLTLSALGSVEDRQCHFAKAQNYFTRAFDYMDRAPSGSSNIMRVGALNSLAAEYVLLGQFEKAKPLLARALKIIDTPQYAQSELLVQVLDRAAELRAAQRRFTDAEKLWNRAISITSPESRFYRLAAIIHLAELECYLKDQKHARDLLRQAEQLYDQLYQTHGHLYAMILADRGLVAMASGDKQGATDLLERALEVSRACEDRDLVDYSEILSYRAMAAEGQHDLITAKAMLSEASRIQRAVLGESPITAHSFFAYARVLTKLKFKSEAKEYERTAKAMLDRVAVTASTSYTVDIKALK